MSEKDSFRDIARLLETHKEFDAPFSAGGDQGASAPDDLVSNLRSVAPSSVVSLGLLYKICTDFEKDLQRRKKLFSVVCENLCKQKYLDHNAILLCDIVANRPGISDRITEFIGKMHDQLVVPVTDLAVVHPVSILRQLSVTYGFEDGFYAKSFQEILKIAHGGFGTVCKALHKVDGVIYAVKKIYFKLKNDKEFRKILREVRSLAALKHTNIVNYNSAWLENSTIADSDNLQSSDSDDTDRSGDSTHHTSKYSQSSSKYSSVHYGDGVVLCCSSSESHSTSTHLSSDLKDKIDINAQATSTDEILSSAHRRRHSSGPTCSHLDPQADNKSLVPLIYSGEPDFSTKQLIVSPTTCHNNLGVQVTLFIQMEYCDSDLRQLLDNRDTVDGKSAWDRIDPINVFHQILCGVEHIHSKSIIHRDLKPRNIFMSKDSNIVKIGDFGLACLVHQTKENCLHCFCSSGGTSAVFGTLPYAAPEQRFDQNYDFKVDIYSLGIIFLELLHPCTTVMEFYGVVEKALKDEYPHGFTKEQVMLIKKMIKIDPHERPDAAEILKSPIFKKKSLKKKIEEIKKTILKLNEAIRRSERDLSGLKEEQDNLSEQITKVTIEKDKEIKILKAENTLLKKLLCST